MIKAEANKIEAKYTSIDRFIMKDGDRMFTEDIMKDLNRKSYLEAENKQLKEALRGLKICLEGSVCECGNKLEETDAYDRVIAALTQEDTP